MFERLPSNWMLVIKSIGYWFWLIPVLGIPLSYYWSLDSQYANAWPWLVIVVVFGIIPLLDFIIGRDPANPDETVQVPQMEQQGYYRLLSLVTVPALLGMLGWAGWVFVDHEAWSWGGPRGRGRPGPGNTLCYTRALRCTAQAKPGVGLRPLFAPNRSDRA